MDPTSSHDIKRERPDLYAPRAGGPRIVVVPPLMFLMADGRGDPNTAPAYRQAVEALYAASYAVRALARSATGRIHVVGPLEGLWSSAELGSFRSRDKDSWEWTLMIVQPEWITADLVGEALTGARRAKSLPALGGLRFECYDEGRSVQVLHVGSYDDEGPAIERLHREFLPAHGLTATARHHEIYLSDARRTPPARLRTILRQPVRG